MRVRIGVLLLGAALMVAAGCSMRSPSKAGSHAPPPHTPAQPTPPPHANNTAKMLVLSYNICWECMSHNSGRTTGGPLGGKCKFIDSPANQTTICADNMANTIEKTAQTYGAFDFVALQEATNWRTLQKRSPALASLRALSYKRGRDDFVTFYNDKKYTLEHNIQWGMAPASRPYQILIFQEELIFINLHNCHGPCINPSVVEESLSTSLQKRLSPADIAKIKHYRIIVAGDLNDHAAKGMLRSFVPFKSTGINTRVSVSKPPKTCCSTSVPWQGTMAGDYILDSKAITTIEVPSNYDRRKLQSDHLPVIGILQAL